MKLLVSDGQVLVPSVVNSTSVEAQRAMQAPEVGFEVVIQPPADCTATGGTVGSTVASQSIPAGLSAQKQTVTLILNCVAAPAPAPSP